jgi:hypothetical protein
MRRVGVASGAILCVRRLALLWGKPMHIMKT